jgi:hypothetical protein
VVVGGGRLTSDREAGFGFRGALNQVCRRCRKARRRRSNFSAFDRVFDPEKVGTLIDFAGFSNGLSRRRSRVRAPSLAPSFQWLVITLPSKRPPGGGRFVILYDAA